MREKEEHRSEDCGGGLPEEMTSSDDEIAVTTGPLKRGDAKRTHSLSDVSDRDTAV